MKKIVNALVKHSSLAIAALALFIGISTANAACAMWFNQPEEPKGMEKFKK